MNLTYFDSETVSEAAVQTGIKKLQPYREQIAAWRDAPDTSVPESALFTWHDEEALASVYACAAKFKKVKHVVLLGIGGSSLGVEAIHSVLAAPHSPQLHVLDTVSAFELEQVVAQLTRVKKASEVAICVISKSGTTTETLANAAVLLAVLEKQLGKAIYAQTVVIGNVGTDLQKAGKKLGAQTLAMPEAIGGRYSVFTTVGLLPLLLLGHDVEALLAGLDDATDEPFEASVAESAARLQVYLKKKYRHLNFFAFDTRLVRLGKWYRQLLAESIGKEHTLAKQPNPYGVVPTISTPVELHSVGQLYFSGFAGVYTDFVTFDDEVHDFAIPTTTKLAPALKKKSLQEINTAIYGGVIGAYQSRQLPYRTTVFEGSLDYALGLFMGMRMLETMYLAKLLDVNAFDQPNVELYKNKTRDILGV